MADLRCLTLGFLLFCLAPSLALPNALNFPEERLAEVAKSRRWRKLLHYQKDFLSAEGSKATKEFFLSPEGRHDPLAELKATIAGLLKPLGPKDPHFEHAYCKFPERYKFLRKELGLKAPELGCPEFEKWKVSMKAEKVSLLFASAFMSSPASVAGHTFLKVGPRKTGQSSIMLDQVVTYAAATGDATGLMYVLRGVFGGFMGDFVFAPYFNTVHTYLNFEQRDLWEYELALDPDQIDTLLNHLWELHWASFRYYFFDENCSYRLMALLEVANPDWNLVDKFHFIVNPADTIRVLNAHPGAIKEVRYQPSLYKMLLHKYRLLAKSDLEVFKDRFIDHVEIRGDESREVLDAAIDYALYANLLEKRWEGADPDNGFLPGAGTMPPEYFRLLQARARLGPGKQESKPAAPKRPDLGHPISRIAVDYGARDQQRFLGLSWRYAYHDLLNPDAGYLPSSQIEFLKFEVEGVFPERKFRLREAKIVDALSLEPVNWVTQQISWSFSAGVYSPPDLDCKNCNAGQLIGGVGLAKALFSEQGEPLLFVLPRASIEYSGWFDHNFRFGPSVLAGALMSLGDFGKFLLTEEVYYYPTQKDRTFYHTASARAGVMLDAKYELRVSVSRHFTSRGDFNGANAALGFYF